jgi:RNA polymerase sigma-70 factor, ECF subfamily
MRAAKGFLWEAAASLRAAALWPCGSAVRQGGGTLVLARAEGEFSSSRGGTGEGPAHRSATTPHDRFSGGFPEPEDDPETGLETGTEDELESGLETGLGSGPEIDEEAQQNGVPGVEEDMATLVLDNPALGARAAVGQSAGERQPSGYAAADPSSDAAIMLRVAAGDEAGFNFLVQKYHRSMINFLFRMVHSQAVAEELAQEVFLRVYRSRESYRADAKFTTWLYRIATNLAVNHARDTKHERAAQNVYLDQPDEESGTTPEVADDRPTVEQSLLKDERMAAIRKHVMALPERHRTAVLMHKYQGLDYRQIGEVLKLSESATKSLLFRAYQTLREKLKEFV